MSSPLLLGEGALNDLDPGRLKERALSTAEVNPDEAAKQRAVADRLGVGRVAVAENPQLARQDAAEGVVESLVDAPATARWYERNADLAADDDVPNLTGLERALKAAGESARSAGREGRLNIMRWNRMRFGETPAEGLRRRMLAADDREAPGLAEFQLESLKGMEDDPAWPWLKTGEDVVQLFGAAAKSIPFMATTAGVTAAAGPVAGFLTAGEIEGGALFETMVDEYQVPEQVARGVASVVGPAIGGVEYLATSKLFRKVLPKTAARLDVGRILGETLTRPGVAGAAMEVAEGTVVEGGTEAIQEVTGNLGTMLAQWLSGQEPEIRVTVNGTEYAGWAAVGLSALEAAKVGAVAGGAVGGATQAAGSARDRKVKEAKTSQQTMEELLKHADASKVRERAPAQYTELVEEAIVEHGALETVLVPSARINELFQAANDDAKAELEAAAPGITSQIAAAAATGVDVSIPTAAFVGRVAHTRIGQDLRKAWRPDPDAMTQEEAEVEAERLVAEARAGVAPDAVDPLLAYQREVEDALVRAGAPVTEARQAALGERKDLEVSMQQYGVEFDEAVRRWGRPEIVSAREAALQDEAERELLQERAGEFDREVAGALLAEVRRDLWAEGRTLGPPDFAPMTEPNIAAKFEAAKREHGKGRGKWKFEADLSGPSNVPPPPGTPERAAWDERGKEQREQRETQQAIRDDFRKEVEDLGIDITTASDAEILDALEARFADVFAAADEPSDLFQRPAKARPIEKRNVARWLRDAEKEGNRGMARRLAEHFAKAPKTEEITSAAKAGIGKRGWYRRSMLAIQHVFGQDAPRFTALLAALSPQDSVENNTRNALRVWRAWTSKEFNRTTDPDAIRRILKRETTTNADKDALKARVNNSITALTAETVDLETFELSGNKVNSFWRNLMGDVEAVTLDAWMATFFGLPGKDFSESKYRALSAAVRKAAQELTEQTGETWTPAEVQETIWSWAKALVEQAASPQEKQLAHEIVQRGGLDPGRITEVPDFAGLLSEAVYAPLIEELGVAERVAEVARGAVEGAGAGAEAAQGPAPQVPAGSPLERAARRVARTVARRRAAGQLELKQERVGSREALERLRGLGLRVEAGENDTMLLVGHDGKKVSIEQLDTPEGMKVFHEALGFPTDPSGRDTIADLKVYRLNISEERLNAWLKKIGWTFRRFGPGTGPKGKPFWPDFRDPSTPTYKDKTVFIFNEQVPEGSFFDPPYTLAWRVPHEVAHALTNPMMDERYGPGFRAGALGKVVRGPFFKEEVARTLTEALRATDWEVETFRAQRAILEREFGVDLTEEEFRKENGVNYAGALYRAITGQFADPNTVGVLPAALDPEQLQKLGRALLEAVAAERGAGTQAPSELESGPRGRFQYRSESYTDLRKVRIVLEKSQNSSTAVHELWHMWWARLETQAQEQLAEDAPIEQLRARANRVVMWERARKFVGARPGEALTERQREKLARAGEEYLREGKAPSLALKEMFDAFRTWLRRVYRTLTELEREAGQPIRLTDDIRQVMDRMLATDDEIAEAKRARAFTPANEAAIVSLMTDDEREAYEAKVAEADREVRERVAQKIHKAAKEAKRASWDEAVEELRDVVTAGVEGRLDVRARTWLATGEWRGPENQRPAIASAGLDDTALVEMYGKLPKRIAPDAVQRLDGLHPDVAAEVLGYTDGDALVRALEALGKEPTEKIVERELRARVKAELGKPDAIGREEIVHALAEVSANVDAIQMTERALARKAGAKSVSKNTVREAARRIVAETPVLQLSPGKHRAAAEREGALAVKHAGAGAYGEAVAAKRRQMLNLFLESEAAKAKERADKDHDRLAWLQGPAASVTLVKAGHTYKDQLELLLERFNLRHDTARQIKRKESFAAWVAAQEAAGETPAVPDHLRDDAYTKNWRELTVSELRDITDAADSIYHIARRKVSMEAAGKRRDRDTARADLVGSLERVTKLPPAQRYADYDSDAEKTLGKKIFSLGAALDKIVAIVDHLDGGNTNGVWHTLVYRPIAEALGRKQDMARKFAQQFHDNMKELVKGKEDIYTRRVATDLPYPDEHGRPAKGRFSKLHMLGIAHNLGNASNRKKLLDGHGWTESQVMAELQKHLTAADWRFVQKNWTLIDKLWPEIAEQERKLNGVELERVIPTELTVLTSDGKTLTLTGGYYPVVYDPDPSKTNWAHKNASRGLFEGVENHFMRAVTGHGHTKARTEVTGPILFDLAIIPRHLDEVIHDLAFRATLLDVDTLLDTKEIKGALQRALGKQYADIFRPWLQSIAQDRVHEPRLMKPWAQLLSRVRVNATSAVLFFRDTTLLAQVSGHTPAIAEMRAHFANEPGWAQDYRDALRDAVMHPVRTAEFVRARSAFMRARVDESDRDRRDQVRQMQGKVLPSAVKLRKAIAFGGTLIANTQFYGVDAPVWLAAFNAAQRLKGMSERDAGFLADQVVRLSQGSGESIDLSEMQRGPEWQKQFTTFYSYVASQWATFRRDTRQLSIGKITRGEFMVRWGLRFTLPALYMTAVRAALPGGAEPPDLEDEKWWDEAWWAFAQTGALDLAGAVPILRDSLSWFRYGRVSPTIPVARAVQEGIELGAEVKRAVTDEVRPVELLTDTLNAIAMVTGLPLVRAADLVKELNEEDDE